MRILDTPTDRLREAFDTNFFSHVIAARALIPALEPHGVYIGINGGLSDFVVPNMGALSMTQSALRSLYSVLAKEALDAKAGDSKAEVRMLALYGRVAHRRRRWQGQQLARRARDRGSGGRNPRATCSVSRTVVVVEGEAIRLKGGTQSPV
jgi:hypothetical protein